MRYKYTGKLIYIFELLKLGNQFKKRRKNYYKTKKYYNMCFTGLIGIEFKKRFAKTIHNSDIFNALMDMNKTTLSQRPILLDLTYKSSMGI